MKNDPRVLVAMEIWQPGLEQIRRLIGAENVDDRAALRRLHLAAR